MVFMPISSIIMLGHGVKIFQPDLVNLYGCTVGDETEVGAFVEMQKNAIIGSRCKIGLTHSSAKASRSRMISSSQRNRNAAVVPDFAWSKLCARLRSRWRDGRPAELRLTFLQATAWIHSHECNRIQ